MEDCILLTKRKITDSNNTKKENHGIYFQFKSIYFAYRLNISKQPCYYNKTIVIVTRYHWGNLYIL